MKDVGVFKSRYDKESDIIYFAREGFRFKESLEVSDDIILDLDKNDTVMGIEILFASEFFKAVNQKISEEILNKIKDVTVSMVYYRKLLIISLNFNIGKIKYEEKLPAFRMSEYESPLVASTTA